MAQAHGLKGFAPRYVIILMLYCVILATSYELLLYINVSMK